MDLSVRCGGGDWYLIGSIKYDTAWNFQFLQLLKSLYLFE